METKGNQKGNMKKTTIQKMYDDNTLGIGEWCDNKIYRKDKKLNFVEWDNDDVQSLVSEIIHTLQDDYGYLKPQPKSTAGNIQGNGIYNWEAHNVLEDLIKEKYNIVEEIQPQANERNR